LFILVVQNASHTCVSYIGHKTNQDLSSVHTYNEE